MSAEKELVRNETLSTFGSEVDDQLEVVSTEEAKAQGAVACADRISQLLERLCLQVDKEFEAGTLWHEWKTETEKRDPDVVLVQVLKKWLVRAVMTASEVKSSSIQQSLIQQGRKDALKRVIDMLKKKIEGSQERAKRFSLREVMIERERGPQPTLKQQRLAEAQHEGHPVKAPQEGEASDGSDTGS